MTASTNPDPLLLHKGLRATSDSVLHFALH